MILGILDNTRSGDALEHELLQAAERVPFKPVGASIEAWANGKVAFCAIPRGIATLDEGPQPLMNEDGTIALVFEGKIHNADELKRLIGEEERRFATTCSGEVLVHLYEKLGERFLDKVNGKFTFALWDGRGQKLLLGRDMLGVESMFYANDRGRLVFGSSLGAMLASGLVEKRVNHDAVLQYLLYCYNPGDETIVKGVRKLPAAYTLSLNGGEVSLKRYWKLSFAETSNKSEEQYQEEILDLMRDAVRIRMDGGQPPGVFLSGGTDSSAMVSLASSMWPEPLNTFSFTCRGKSYDESSYAKFVAQHFGANHTEIAYDADRLGLMQRAVEYMDEPFSDIGIEIATFLLGTAAKGKVSYVFSGEGGDELFAGHPVYTADKVAAFVDPIPKALLSPVARLLQRIPDSDQKRNLQVKVKRFAYSLAFPKELLSHRWRIYYTPAEIRKLCSPDFVAHARVKRMYDDMTRFTREADGRDGLSRSLYSDYHTIVDFYLRRVGLLKASSVESRLPLMDYRLVEYAATIPSNLKIKGMSDTKYIYRRTLESIVPHKILYDRPKLGHSVPMKNWLREDDQLKGWVDGLLFDGALRKSGMFDMDFVKRLVDAHRGKRDNNSHRLWGLAVLALWMERWMGK